jgi:transposase
MRGTDERSGALFSFVDLEERVPKQHPLRKIRQIVNDALASLDGEFSRLYAAEGRPSIAPRSCCARRCCRRSTRSAPSAS